MKGECETLDEQYINEMLEKLKSGDISEFYVKKEDFLTLREILVARSDFKHFRGIAQRNGDVIYQYRETPRS